MRYVRLAGILLLILLFSAVSLSVAQETTPEPESTEAPTDAPEATEAPTTAPEATEEAEDSDGSNEGEVYIVQPGDNLYRIALRHGTTTSVLAAANNIVNPGLIFVGQRISIPSGTTPETPVPPTPAVTAEPPEATAEPTSTGTGTTKTYTVLRGDTLFRIAVNNGTTVSQLVALNQIVNANLIFVGQQLTIPVSDAGSASNGGGDIASAFSQTDFGYGIEVAIAGQDLNAINSQVSQLGMDWVKIVVRWADLEPVQGQIDFRELDTAINSFQANGLNILLNVTAAPDWARLTATSFTAQFDAPPDNYDDFGTFITTIAERYQGKVAAYEIWKEPNRVLNWAVGTYTTRQPDQSPDAFELGADHYVELLGVAYRAIKAADTDAIVISAGLAPVGWTDNYNVIEDRAFLHDMLSNGVLNVSDAIGTEPLGFGNPPTATCCEQPPGVDSHFDLATYYFMDTLGDYRDILEGNNGSTVQIWVTRFGWGTAEGSVIAQPGEDEGYLNYNSAGEQARYAPVALEVMQDLNYVGPTFLYNLNACQVGDQNGCYYSLIDLDGAARPVFGAVQAIDKAQGN